MREQFYTFTQLSPPMRQSCTHQRGYIQLFIGAIEGKFNSYIPLGGLYLKLRVLAFGLNPFFDEKGVDLER